MRAKNNTRQHPPTPAKTSVTPADTCRHTFPDACAYLMGCVVCLPSTDLPLASASSDGYDQTEQGPAKPHAGRSTFLPSSGGAGVGYYRVDFDTGPNPTEDEFPCWTLVARLVQQ